MASEKKKPVERKIISASEAKKESKKTVSSGEQRKVQEAKHAPEGSTPKGRAIGRRVAAVILWSAFCSKSLRSSF